MRWVKVKDKTWKVGGVDLDLDVDPDLDLGLGFYLDPCLPSFDSIFWPWLLP